MQQRFRGSWSFPSALLLAVALVVVILLPGTASGASRATSPRVTSAPSNWGVGSEVTLPANAAANNPNVSINSVSCSSAGNCSAVGAYKDSSGNTEGLLLTETAGSWAAGVEASLPANAGTNPFVQLNSVSCASAGNCTAIGLYLDDSPNDNGQGLLLTETAGTWSTGVEAALPGDATSINQTVQLSSVSCPSAGNCIGVGSYLTGGPGSGHGLILTETAGSWSAGTGPALPVNASTTKDSLVASVSCPSVGTCTAVGAYNDSSEARQGLLLTELSGTWATGVEAALPANARTNPGAYLDSVSCASAGNCSAVGGYLDASNDQEALLITKSAGSWGTGVEAVLPANASANPIAVVPSISCPSAGNCSAVGNYRDGSGNESALLLTETAGTWADGTEAALPANAAGDPYGGAALTSVSCASAGNCSAVGGYNSAVGAGAKGESLLLAETAGSWSTGTEVALPSNADGSNGLASVSCASVGQCSAVGSYGISPPTGGVQGLVVATTSTAPQETLTVSKTGTGTGTVTSSPAGIDCGSTCAVSFDIGSEVTLTATPGQDSTFDGWGGCDGVGTCQVSMSGDTAIAADFPKLSHLLTVQKSGSGSGTVSSGPAGIDCGSTCANTFADGTQVTLTATPDSDSKFTGWSGGGCSGTGKCQVTVGADTTITATFDAAPKPPAKCVVPKVKGKTLSAAKRAIKSHNCSVGKVKHAASRKIKKGDVISQSPSAGRHLKRGAKVSLVVSNGKR